MEKDSKMATSNVELKKFLNVQDFAIEAKKKLDKQVYDYYASGANDMVTLRRNEEAFHDLIIRPRILQDASKITLSTTVLGTPVDYPILIAPSAMQSKKELIINNLDCCYLI
jgi:(S)-2-hydroxy-acid oxidase